MVDEPLGVLELEESLSDVERPPDISAGKYVAECQDIQEAISQGKGNHYYAIRLVIPTDELSADIREHYPDGYTTNWNRQLIPKRGDRRALYNLRKMVEAFGLDANTTSFDPNELMGRRVLVSMAPGQLFQGERRMEVKTLEPAPESGESAPRRRGSRAKEEEVPTSPPARGRQANAGSRSSARR